MSAALAAKVAAPASDRATLSAVYAGMARDWAERRPHARRPGRDGRLL